MKYLVVYLKELIKFLILWAILSGVMVYFFPNKITLIIILLFFIACFGVAADEVKKLKTEESKKILNPDFSFPEEKEKKKSSFKEESIFEDIDLD